MFAIFKWWATSATKLISIPVYGLCSIVYAHDDGDNINTTQKEKSPSNIFVHRLKKLGQSIFIRPSKTGRIAITVKICIQCYCMSNRFIRIEDGQNTVWRQPNEAIRKSSEKRQTKPNN